MGYVNAICPFRKRDVREITKRRVGKGGVEEIATIMPFAYLTFHLKSTDGGLEEIETTREFSFFLFALSLSLLFFLFSSRFTRPRDYPVPEPCLAATPPLTRAARFATYRNVEKVA